MLYGNVHSTHKHWYAVLLKVRTYLIHSLVSCSQMSPNIFALCNFWCKEPYLSPAAAAPSFPCQSYVHHVHSAGLADWGSRPTDISLGTLRCPGQGLCNCPALVDRPKVKSQHPELWVTLFWVQIFCGFRPHFPTASCHLEQLKVGCDGVWSPRGTGVCILCSNTSSLGFLCIFLLKELCGACCLHPLGGATPFLMSVACISPSWKGGFQKITEKAEAGKEQSATLNEELLLAS